MKTLILLAIINLSGVAFADSNLRFVGSCKVFNDVVPAPPQLLNFSVSEPHIGQTFNLLKEDTYPYMLEIIFHDSPTYSKVEFRLGERDPIAQLDPNPINASAELRDFAVGSKLSFSSNLSRKHFVGCEGQVLKKEGPL